MDRISLSVLQSSIVILSGNCEITPYSNFICLINKISVLQSPVIPGIFYLSLSRSILPVQLNAADVWMPTASVLALLTIQARLFSPEPLFEAAAVYCR